uniref:(northern house mosquito) hypothetical protein n=1 Tax=Culex pipiens TaxID=7175 RepID=A0A8D8BD83_CULPI
MTTGRRLRRFLRWTGQLFCWIVAGVRPAGVVTTTTTATSDCEVCSIRPSASCVRTTVPLLFLLRLVGQSPRGTDTRNVTPPGNRFRNFFPISRHFQRPLAVIRAPTVATSRCQSGRCGPPQQSQQHTVSVHDLNR